MSGGISARFGFYFSDLHIVQRVLKDLLDRRAAQIEGRDPPRLRTFQIESPIDLGGAPSWDILEEPDGQTLIIEEVKSGPLDKSDREILWRRIRRTVSRLGRERDVRVVVPRLTVNQDKPTGRTDDWFILRDQIGQASGFSTPERFESAKDLAEEALYWLTHDEGESDEHGVPLTQERAREVLSRFDFRGEKGFNALRDEVQWFAELLFSLGVEEVCTLLVGEIYKRSSDHNTDQRRFTSEDIEVSLCHLNHLSSVNQEDARLWQVWKALQRPDEHLGGSDAPLVDRKLAYQSWREVQPVVAKSLASGLPPLLALVGRGGLGKSVLLAKLREESETEGARTLWLAGDSLYGRNAEQVGRALSLGAWASSVEEQMLRVFIDGLENAADSEAGLKALIACLGDLFGANVSLAVTIRAATWSGLAGTQERLPRWIQVELLDWDETRVAELVRTSQRNRPGAELLRLLRTPLLLDLFLRTFSIGETVPEGLQTRHGVLHAYWQRRVLPDGRVEAAARLEKLMQCCDGEAEGRHLHVIAAPAMQQLFSEGVLTQQQGAWRFRHPLLRDFAVMRWAAMSGQTASDVIGKLRSIKPSLTRWGGLRAIFEAASDPSSVSEANAHSIDELIGAIRDDKALLLPAAEILGELDDLSAVELERILAALAPVDLARDFLDRLLESRPSLNEGWLKWVASLPPGSDWPDRTSWVSDSFLLRTRELLESTWKKLAPLGRKELTTDARAIALRLRNWSSSQKFRAWLEQGDGFHRFHLMLLVSEHLPEQATLEWLSSHVNDTWRTRWGCLEALPVLLSGAMALGKTLDSSAVVELYLHAAGLRRDVFGLRHDASATLFNAEHERTSVALLGHDSGKHQGLLRAAPELFLPVAFDMLTGLGEDEYNEELRSAISEALEAYSQPEQALDEAAEVEAGLLPAMSHAEALGNLIDDTGGEQYQPMDHERAEIVNALENLVQDALTEGSSFVESIYWPAAKKSRSAISWVLLLELLTQDAVRKPALLDELITHRPFYHLRSSRLCLHRAIASRWPHIGESTKKIVLSHIESSGLYGVAPLASAIPIKERPSWAEPSFELYRSHGWDPVPERQELEKFVYVGHDAQEEEEIIPGLPSWARVERWTGGGLDAQQESLFQAMADVKAALASGLPTPVETARSPQVLRALQQIFARLALHTGVIPSISTIEEQEVRRLVRWGLEVAAACSTHDLETDSRPIKISQPPDTGISHPWTLALGLLNTMLFQPSVKEDLSLNRELFEEIDRRSSRPSPLLAYYIFRRVSTYHWGRPGGEGRKVLSRLIFERVRDPGALVMAFRHIWFMGVPERERCFRSWLTDSAAGLAEGDVVKFVAEVGLLLGEVAFHQEEGEPNNLRRLTDELLSCPPSGGLLARADLYRHWAVNVAFGAKEQLRQDSSPIPRERLRDFCALMESIWSRIGYQRPVRDGVRWVTFLLHPLQVFAGQSRDGAGKVQGLWRYLESLSSRVIQEGLDAEVCSLVRGLKERKIIDVLGCQSFWGIVDALDRRALQLKAQLREPPAEPGHGWLDAYEYASEMLTELAHAKDASQNMRNKLHAILQTWANPDLGVPNAAAAARAIQSTEP